MVKWQEGLFEYDHVILIDLPIIDLQKFDDFLIVTT